ncbi:MAG: hypothetical protein ACC662_02225, partial [Planctomycetota bacterium]
QCPLFCDEPWLAASAAERLRGGGNKLDPVVVAAFLRYVGARATPEGIDLCRKFLSNPGRAPKGRPAWDVRYHAVLGLLIALASGRAEEAGIRQGIIDALDAGAARGLPPGRVRDTLRSILANERRHVLEDPSYVLPERRLLALADSFHDPYGLGSRDLRDVAIVRLNDMLPQVFNINSLRPGTPGNRDKTEIPRRFLKASIDAYPYFSRLDLFSDRGRRPPPTLARSGNPAMEVDRR